MLSKLSKQHDCLALDTHKKTKKQNKTKTLKLTFLFGVGGKGPGCSIRGTGPKRLINTGLVKTSVLKQG